MPLLVIGLSHRTSHINVRERFAIAEAQIPATLQRLRDTGLADEAVILSTCNRVELYAVTPLEPRRACDELRQFLLNCADYRDPLTDEIYTLTEPHSLEHLFKVACGLDSMVLGETEILGQLKKPTTSRSSTGTPARGSTRHFKKPSTSPSTSAPRRTSSAAAPRSARSRWSWRRKFLTRSRTGR